MIVLARHGESEFSVRGALNGDRRVPCALTPAGIAQARMLGEALADEPLELCITTGFQRTLETADEALRGRDVPRLVVPEAGDPLYGPYEGADIERYRDWAQAAHSSESPGLGGESRFQIVERYARAFRIVLARPEASILLVAHSLPLAYALAARDGIAPAARARSAAPCARRPAACQAVP